MESKWKLKDPGVCRIFFSSPFNGMEGEREALTSQYWPQIQSLCNSRGIQFVPVDMRWGITLDHSAEAQTINICLREIDRSDIFVGFFGQRYGWQGVNDEALQASFDAAIPAYPWLEQYRNRSVTELEFLHGHLRTPGKLPAFICFREKAYDDKFYDEGVQKNDKKAMYKFHSESDLATELMADLQHRVKESESDTIGINMAYKTPKEGAKMMFDAVMKVLSQHLLDDATVTRQSLWDQEIDAHDSFCDTRCGIYKGGEQMMEKLNKTISDSPQTRTIITGEPGSGKSALLCNWLKSLKKTTDFIVAYHFIGCTPQSTAPANVSKNLIVALQMGSWERSGVLNNLTERAMLEKENSFYKDALALDAANAKVKLERTMKEVTSAGFKVIVIVDALNKIQYKETISKPLFWIPKDLPKGVHIVLSTQHTDDLALAELDARQYQKLDIPLLDLETRTALCKEVLMLRGKQLSKDQLPRVVSAEKTENPLYLTIALEELCNFGKFRFLDQKIDALISSESSAQLFEQYLDRLEEDYNTNELEYNLVEQVVCCLALSRRGWNEADLCEMLSIESHQWTPLYYALDKYLSKANDRLGVAYLELEDAIFEKYIQTEERKQEFYHIQLQHHSKKLLDELLDQEKLEREAYRIWELCWICVETSDRKTLLKLVAHYPIFQKLNWEDRYELFQYVNFLGMRDEDFKRIYEATVAEMIPKMYSNREEYLEEDPNPIDEMLEMLTGLCDFLDEARFFHSKIHFLKRKISLLENNVRGKEQKYQRKLYDTKYSIGCCYVDMNDYDAALPTHMAAYNYFKNVVDNEEAEDKRSCMKQLAMCCNGIGALYLRKKENLEEAKEYFGKSRDIHSQLTDQHEWQKNVLAALTNLAQTYMLLGENDAAITMYEDVAEQQDKLYVNVVPPELSHTITNLGICYRYSQQFEKAEVVYQKALDIKMRAYGELHEDVAIGFYNFGKLFVDYQNYEKAHGYFSKALDILQILKLDDADLMCMTRECLAQSFMALQRWDEAEEQFWMYAEYRTKKNRWGRTLQASTYAMLDVSYLKKDYGTTRKIAEMLADADEKHVSSENIWYYLSMLEELDPRPASSTPVPFNRTIDKGIEWNPTSRLLINRKISYQLAPAGDLEGIYSVMNVFFESSTDDEMHMDMLGTTTNVIAEHCPQHQIAFYEHWRPTFPASRIILRNLAVEYYGVKRFEEALECFTTAVKYEPDDPALMDKVALSSLMCGKFDVTKATIQTLETRWPENEQLMQMVEKYKSCLQEVEAAREEEANQEATKESNSS